jgi:hypothetical protein
MINVVSIITVPFTMLELIMMIWVDLSSLFLIMIHFFKYLIVMEEEWYEGYYNEDGDWVEGYFK